MKKYLLWVGLLSALVTLSCTTGGYRESAPTPPSDISAALESIDGAEMLRHIQVLASDEFEGRAPGTRGETLTVDYLIKQFEGLHLTPGNPDNTYVQRVPLVGYTSHPTASFRVGDKNIHLKFPDDLVAWSLHGEQELKIENSELVFVGYGVIAPEYAWNDYKGVDLRGKTLVMLINDPQIPDPNDPSKLDEQMFKGKAMTYYGRWTYKFEMAAKLGATAAIIVHETIPAAYPYSVVVNSWARENFAIQSTRPSPDYPALVSWLHLDRAKELFTATGYDFETMKKAALSKDFKPVPMNATVSFALKNTGRIVDSHNVLAKIEGSHPRLKDEYVIYTAHWDHFGWDPKLPGTKHDQIYHGALDNASGVAALLALAKAFRALPQPPQRSILFIATTAEEQQLLGAKFYATHPLYPLRRTLADINMDGMNLWGRTLDVEIVGFGKSTIDDLLAEGAAVQSRIVRPESRPELGGFYRADHLEFAKAGVPVMYMRRGNKFVGKPDDYGRRMADAYIANDYHKVTDTVRPEWDFSGAVEDTQLLFRLGHGIAQRDRYPEWNLESEFKAARDKMMTQGQN